jgi:osmotically-inducible protein OsmY
MLKSQGIGIITIIIAVLWLASLACRLGTQSATPTVQVLIPATATRSVEAPSAVQATATEQAITEPTASPGKISITIDDAQLNALVANELNKQNNPELANPSIHLQNGQILVSGEVNRSGLKANFSGTLTVNVTQDGRLHYNVISASLGPLPLPQAMRDQVETQLNNALGTPQTQAGQQIFVEDVKIGNGVMTITGHIR